MALVFHSGFETYDFSEWTNVTGSPSIDDIIKKTGDHSMQCDTTGGAATAFVGWDPPADIRLFTVYIYIASLPTGDIAIIGNLTQSYIVLTSTGELDLYEI